MKKIVLLVVILSLQSILLGQNEDYVPSDITPPSIENYYFTKYGNLDVPNNTGAFTYSIPLFNISSGNIQLNTNINYYTEGVRLNDIAGLTGMNWNLNMGGMITRVVRGIPDENAEIIFRPERDSINFILSGNYSDQTYAQSFYDDFESIFYTVLPEEKNVDSQQDLFTFNFNGISGEFVINDGDIYINENKNLKAHLVKKNVNGEYIYEFSFTTMDGISYLFYGKENYIERTMTTNNCSQGAKKPIITTWHLSKIEDTNNNFVEFTYKNSFKNYPLNYYENYSIVKDYLLYPGSIVNKNVENCLTLFYSESAKYISSISSSSGSSVVISYHDTRKDYTSGKLLQSINLISKNKSIKNIDFEYENIGATSGFIRYTGDEYKYRVYLKSLKINDDKYSFKYQTPNLLPYKFVGTDKEGFANSNNSSNLINFRIEYNIDQDLFIKHFGDRGANFNVNENTSLSGNLIEITYPTGGKSKIKYENHLTTENKLYNLSESKNIFLEQYSCSNSVYPNSNSYEFVSNGTPIEFIYRLFIEKCDGVYVEDLHDVFGITIRDETKNKTLVELRGNKSRKTLKTSSGSETANNVSTVPPVQTIKGNKYSVLVDVGTKFNNVRSTLSLGYNHYEEFREEVVNYSGSRVNEILDEENNQDYSKKIFIYNSYFPENNLNSDKTSLIHKKMSTYYKCVPTHNKRMGEVIIDYEFDVFNCQTIQFSTNNFFSQVNATTKPFQYKFITIVTDKDIKQQEYNVSPSLGSSYEIQNYVSDFNRSNNLWNENQLKNEKKFKKTADNEYSLIQDVVYTYNKLNDIKFPNYNIELGLYPIDRLPLMAPRVKHDDYDCVLFCYINGHFGINLYYNHAIKSDLSKVQTTDYFPTGNVITETSYNYDSPNHLQLTKQTTNNSKGEDITTEYQYPPDLTSSTYTESAMMQKLVNANRISEPVIVKQKTGTVYTSEVHTKYKEFNSIVQKSEVHQKKGAGINITKSTDRKITYNSYDAQGNLTQYTMENGIPVAIIWGYNGQYPIAKVEGQTYASLGSRATALITASNSSAGLTANSFNTLRTDFPNALVTGYVYQPLVGVTMIVQPNGQVEKYAYDEAGRLEEIRNHDNEILKTFQYNYAQP